MSLPVLSSLEELIQSQKRLLPKGQSTLKLMYIGNGEGDTAPALQETLHQAFLMALPEGQYCFISNPVEPCYRSETYDKAVGRFHFKNAWVNNPFKGVQNALFLDPPNGLPLIVRASNPEIRVICAFTQPPKHLDAFNLICEEADVVLLPKGIFVAAQFRNRMKKHVQVHESELVETILNQCQGGLWQVYASSATQHLERIFVRDSHTTGKFPLSLGVERTEHKAVMVVDSYENGLPALAGAGSFDAMLKAIAPTIKALYVDAELLDQMPDVFTRPNITDVLRTLLRESIRIETRTDYVEAV
jgi:hypothetical protein